jgi:hypothetical protein
MTLENFRVVNKNKDGFSMRCKDCQKKYNNDYYQKNRDVQIEKARINQKENWDRHLELARNHGQKKEAKEKVKLRGRKWREAGKQREYYSNNTDKTKEYREKRKVKNHKITNKEWENCKKYFIHRCAYCGLKIEEHYITYRGKIKLGDFHKEHVDDNGENNLSNCVPSCRGCNSSKSDIDFNKWYNEENPVYDIERYNRIKKWINEDHKKYIISKYNNCRIKWRRFI